MRLFGVTLSLVATQRSSASELQWLVMYVPFGRNCCFFNLSFTGDQKKHAETFHIDFDFVQSQIYMLNVAKHGRAVQELTDNRGEQKPSMTSNVHKSESTQIVILGNIARERE